MAYLSVFFGSRKRRKYQAESTKVSIVSVSLFAAPPHLNTKLYVLKKNEREKGQSDCEEVTH